MNKLEQIVILLIAGLMIPVMPLAAQTIYHTGNEEPVETNHLPGLVLAGGSTDNDDAMKWMLARADGGDVVVLRASGSNGYNNYFYSELGVTVNSVTSIVIQSTEQANDEEVVNILNNAEVVFIAGGNQWNYIDYWRDTALLEALDLLINEKKITIGGTSAGMAVLGEVVYSAQNGTIWSSEALEDPYHYRLTLEEDFLEVPFMESTVTDSHYNREESDGNDRKGRHVAFMARMVTDWGMPAKGIAANEYTAIAVDETGKARVFGHPSYPDFGYFLKKHSGPPEVCEEGTPLTWTQSEQAIRVYKVKGDFDGSGWFDIDGWEEGEGGDWQYWWVDEGVLNQVDEDDNTSTGDLQPASFSLELYPNPAGEHLTASITNAETTLTLNLRAPDGTLLKTMPVHPGARQDIKLSVEDLPAGIYFLELGDGRKKVVKQWAKHDWQ